MCLALLWVQTARKGSEGQGVSLPRPGRAVTGPGAAHLHGVEDGLQGGQHVAEEKIPRLCQRVQQLLSCGHRSRHGPSRKARQKLTPSRVGPNVVSCPQGAALRLGPGLEAPLRQGPGTWQLGGPRSTLTFLCLRFPLR